MKKSFIQLIGISGLIGVLILIVAFVQGLWWMVASVLLIARAGRLASSTT